MNTRKIIAVANQKGGVGKTTTASALIAGLSNDNFRVLGIDLDPQGNLSDNCGAEMYKKPTVYELLKNEAVLSDTIQTIRGFDIIPSNIMLAGAEQELSQTGKEHRLKEKILPVAADYDYIVIDTPPSLGVLTINAFTFANEIIIPTTAGIFAANGIRQLNVTVENVRKYCNPNVKVAGILLTKFNPRTNIGKQIKELTKQLGRHIDAPIFETFIRNGIAVEEAQANRTDIFTYSSKSTVSEDYKAFINEYLKGAN
jgi:chromosome partitioning protein